MLTRDCAVELDMCGSASADEGGFDAALPCRRRDGGAAETIFNADLSSHSCSSFTVVPLHLLSIRGLHLCLPTILVRCRIRTEYCHACLNNSMYFDAHRPTAATIVEQEKTFHERPSKKTTAAHAFAVLLVTLD